MYHPTYAWMFFNWYLDDWWLANTSCINASVKGENLERVITNSLVFDHYPRIEGEDKDKPNQGKVVSGHIYTLTVLISLVLIRMRIIVQCSIWKHNYNLIICYRPGISMLQITMKDSRSL